MACFFCCRRWFKAQARRMISKNQNLKAIVRTVEKRGFKLLFMIRLAPYPYNILNLALSLTHIPISTYAGATALSLLKLSLHVYIGSTLSTLTSKPSPPTDGDKHPDPIPDPNAKSKPLRIFVLVAGIIVGIIVGAYVGLLAKREIDLSESARMEQRLQRMRMRRRRRREREWRARMEQEDATETDGARRGVTNDWQNQGVAGLDHHVPSVDLTNQGQYRSRGSDYVGGLYFDDEDDEDEDHGREHQMLFQQGRDRGWDANYGEEDVDEMDDDMDEEGAFSDSEDSVLFDNEDEDEDEDNYGGEASLLERGTRGSRIELNNQVQEEDGIDISDNRLQ
ncbi:hypothetical protein BGZ94_001518 [Podila epigama]|nr:hypothetical protein BGZ94_001518 [Podila epigama]